MQMGVNSEALCLLALLRVTKAGDNSTLQLLLSRMRKKAQGTLYGVWSGNNWPDSNVCLGVLSIKTSANHLHSLILCLNGKKNNVWTAVLGKHTEKKGVGWSYKATVINPKHQSEYSH